MGRASSWVYCAGPLFNAIERQEMQQVADALWEAGFDTFLPQRDGLELTVCARLLIDRDFTQDQATLAVSRAIFALDVYQVVEHCEAIVVNLNGRVPDEGAVSEAAMAWCAGKVLVGYKADGRSVLMGQDNPLVAGLFGFELCSSIGKVVQVLKRKICTARAAAGVKAQRQAELASYLDLGKRIWGALHGGQGIEDVAVVLSEFAPVPKTSPASASEA